MPRLHCASDAAAVVKGPKDPNISVCWGLIILRSVYTCALLGAQPSKSVSGSEELDHRYYLD